MESVGLLEQPVGIETATTVSCTKCVVDVESCVEHKKCIECTTVKARVNDFSPRHSFCAKHKAISDRNARRVKADHCDNCRTMRAGFYRQPRCHDCDKRRGARQRLICRVRRELTVIGRDASVVEVKDTAQPSIKIKALLPQAISKMIGASAKELGFCMDPVGAALAKAVESGDREAAEELLRRCEPFIRNAARTKDPNDIEDLLQEARFVVYQRVAAGKYDPSRSKLETFVSWKARGAASTAKRKGIKDRLATQSYSRLGRDSANGRCEQKGVDFFFGRIRDTFSSATQDNLAALELRESIDKAFSALDPIDATIIRLSLIDKLTMREIEDCAQRGEHGLPKMSRSAVLVRQHNALEILRSKLSEDL